MIFTHPSFRFGLRIKLFLLSLFLFAIPLLGYQYIWEMEKYLRIGQEKTLMGTVRAVATALHERPQLFDKQASFLPNVQRGRDLYAYNITEPIQLDGKLSDWPHHHGEITYQEEYVITGQDIYQPETLSFKHMVGKYKHHLYAYFAVTDENIVYRGNNTARIDQNDLLQIAFITPEEQFSRYIISTKKAGWVTAYQIETDSPKNNALAPENRIQGMWVETEQGYNIELRIPLNMLGSKLSFAITDIDQNREKQEVTIGTAKFTETDQLGTVLLPSPEIERILKGLDHSESRIWVVDKHGRVLAKAGDIKTSSGVWGGMTKTDTNNTWYSPIHKQLLSVYNKILTTPPKDFNDELYDSAKLEGSHLDKALQGESGATWRLTTDNKAVVLSAAYPIYSDGQVKGAVIAEETTNAIRSLRNQALQGWFNIIIAVMGLGTLALFIFASRISNRIRALRNQTELSIDEQGKILTPISSSNASDEIGDLQRTFALMVQRLGQYTHYLQGLSASLSHELRTPVAVVKSSLESLELDLPASQDNVYMHRAKEGVNRLSTILTLMSEATRLEQSLKNTKAVSFNINEVVYGCVQGYQLTQPQQSFNLDINTDENLPCASLRTVKGGPELFAQLIDKLLANAVDFAMDNTNIDIKLIYRDNNYILTISNIGELLPAEMQERLFDSMVSVRKSQQSSQPHLGLGLYIAQIIASFHQGKVRLKNNNDLTGVDAIVVIPTAE